ncbi:ABC-type manganese/zinc transport system, permease component [Thermococcus kodakarensis KOD1]|uniref:ABC-type manganese/zinc transport system, permease component n=1 Tax=Thermococcus kodakarensis (strain ATCC BAA-918 / JCM 12380 / KOD1) TaxID=69014 RepID=Q5JH76_THEKO|nr:metal ABC transporter permease [Thermococcus kodakarensis]WCN28816.1 metal ABC transporter permease [Thermococcus kodakarensis]WCN31116.1 metal ABC transporter permease [Thermococcus kodakarensis]BAD84993.1 ABC-type manganese/zinc transport system, permease component [Thermococcus kodakarensis KOD1]
MIPEFLIRALLASIMVSVLLGLLSPIINTKGLAFLTHALFHALLFGAVLGMILALLLNNYGLVILTALVVTTLLVILIAQLEKIGFTSDSAVGIVSSFVAGLTVLGFGVLYKVMATRPYFPLTQNIVSYLTGDIFLVTLDDLTVLIVGGAVVFFVLLLLYRDFLYISFDMEGVESYGGNARAYLTILYVLVGVIGALIVQTVGLITLQVVAILPGAIALMVSSDFRKVLGISLLLTLTVQLTSVVLAYFTAIPPSGIATIMLGIVYGALLFRR